MRRPQRRRPMKSYLRRRCDAEVKYQTSPTAGHNKIMTNPSLYGIGKRGKVAIVIAALLVVLIAVSALSLGASTTTTTTCFFQTPQVVQISSPGTLTFQGCLKSGESLYYPMAVLNPAGFTMSGSITAQNPIQITIDGGSGCLNCVLYTKNGTASASFRGLSLLPQTGYAINIKNLSVQNNTLTMSLDLLISCPTLPCP
jgi:hypothetical protein